MFNIKTTSPLLEIISLPSLKKVFHDSRCSEIFVVSVLKPAVTISEFNLCCICIYGPKKLEKFEIVPGLVHLAFFVKWLGLVLFKDTISTCASTLGATKKIQLLLNGNDFRLQKNARKSSMLKSIRNIYCCVTQNLVSINLTKQAMYI